MRSGSPAWKRAADHGGRPLLDKTTMRTKEPQLKKDIERRASDLDVFGVDAAGHKHRWDPRTGLLVVTDPDGDVEFTKAISRERITARDGWLNFVEDKRGWIAEWWTAEEFGEALKRRREAEETLRERL